ncbi:hypothetical protein BJ508DRAFT_344038 [Ascobolus immersus RN42]|uniref:Uncharacterized protein n=1 Tax=Ascobolus immersus RN42 TaxID=1160509 RepID=A0A3N4HHI7_ASCIM|nr:hypothetical protein BJ508DRAFT_344038 [Ascobolus immersus RN42]
MTVTFNAVGPAYAYSAYSQSSKSATGIGQRTTSIVYDVLFLTTATFGPVFTYGFDGVWLMLTEPEDRATCILNRGQIVRFFAIPIDGMRIVFSWVLSDWLPSSVYPFLVISFLTLSRYSSPRLMRLLTFILSWTGAYYLAKIIVSAADQDPIEFEHGTGRLSTVWEHIRAFPWFVTYLFFSEVLLFLFITWLPNQKYTEAPSEYIDWSFGQIYAMLAAILTISIAIFHAWADEVEVEYGRLDADGKPLEHYLSLAYEWNRPISQRIVELVDNYRSSTIASPPEANNNVASEDGPIATEGPKIEMRTFDTVPEITMEDELEDGFLNRRVHKRQTWAGPSSPPAIEPLLPIYDAYASRNGGSVGQGRVGGTTRLGETGEDSRSGHLD